MPTPVLIDVLQRGYFPKELPPTFTTTTFGTTAVANPAHFDNAYRACKWGSLGHYHFARPGTLRRGLAITNPIFQFQLSKEISDNWIEIDSFIQKSPLSISKPVAGSADERAIRPTTPRSALLDARLNFRASHRIMLKADVSQFYPTVYTHTVPWALHTRSVAKARPRDQTLLGNRLDSCLKSCQDLQTKGIPIGPDTSLVISELLLSACDLEIKRKFRNLRGFRYYDDYELYFESRAEAEKVLPDLEAILASYELSLNPTKCGVETVLQSLDHPWARIRRAEVRVGDWTRQRNDLIFLFEEAFQLAREHPTDHVLKYTIGRMENVRVLETNLDLYSKLLCQSIMIEHAVLPLVLNQLIWYRVEDAIAFDESVDDKLLRDVLNRHVVTHSRLGNSSEVAWAVWGAIALRKRLGKPATREASKFEDSVVALLTLAARNEGVITNAAIDETWWRSQMTYDALLGENWLLAYEAVAQGWLTRTPTAAALEPRVQAARYLFDFLSRNGVRFFRPFYSHDPSLQHIESYGDASAEEADDDDLEPDDIGTPHVNF